MPGLEADHNALVECGIDRSFLSDHPIFVSPHSASTVAAENARIVDLFCQNLRAYLDGAPMVNVLDRVLLY